MASSTIDQREIQHFSIESSRWWDEDGPFAPLHKLNPIRLEYIKYRICEHYGRDFKALKALKGLSVLDIGCGGGLVCEPMARMGATVTGLDADPVAIGVAQEHAQENALDIVYKNEAAENMNNTYDIVIALEIIEHVTDPQAFVKICAGLIKPGGLIIFSTLNRTAKSYAFGIVAAEHILNWVPRGTHSWKKFIKPSELARMMRTADIKPIHSSGLIFNPLKNSFRLAENDLDVNYFMCGRK